MKTNRALLTLFAMFAVSQSLFGQFSYVDNNPSINIVPYGGTFTYSVTWINGEYNNIPQVALVYFSTPTGDIDYTPNLFPANYTFNYTITGVTAVNSGNYHLELYSTGDPNPATTNIALYISPAILTQPTNTICISGSSTTMGIIAGPNTASFQWFNAATQTSITGTSTSPTFIPTTANNGERVYCKISNSYGSATSSNALLTVGVAPSITAQPTNITAVFGSSATFSVTISSVASTPLYYQWYKNGLPVSGANLANINFGPITVTNLGTYQVVITNLFGMATSASAALISSIPTIIKQPTNVYAVFGSSVTFGVGATGTQPLYYQWYKDGDAMSGANLSYIILPSVTNTDAGTYGVIVSNQLGQVISSNAILVVGLAPSLTNQPQSQTVIYGQTAIFTSGATGTAPLNYQWAENGSALTGVTNSALIFTNAQGSNSGTYSVNVFNLFGSASSTNAVLTVDAPPTITTQPASLNVPVGSNATFIVIATSTPPAQYEWFNSGGQLTNATNNSFAITGASLSNADSYYVVVTNFLGSATSTVAVLAVGYPPVITTNPASQTNVVDGTVVFNGSATGSPPIALQWLKDGFPLTKATNGILNLTNLVPGQIGYYSLFATNTFGAAVSSKAAISLVGYDFSVWQGLIAYYPFDGNANDESGNGFNGTVVDATLTTDRFGNTNSAYYFNGTNSSIDLPECLVNQLAGTNAVSVSVWFQTTPDTTNQNREIVAFGAAQTSQAFIVGTISGQYSYSEWQGYYNVYSEVLVADGNWHHGATVYDGTNVTLYVDGIQTTNEPVVSDRAATGGIIGASMTSQTPEYWNGGIDDVRLYNRALSSNEVSALYALEVPHPVIEANDGSLGFASGQFGFSINGMLGETVVIESSTNLQSWIPIQTNSLGASPFYFSDPQSNTDSMRFYRLQLQ